LIALPTFAEFPYARPVMPDLVREFNGRLALFSSAATLARADEAMTAINDLRENFETMREIASIRHTLDTTGETYKAERDFFDEIQPEYEGLTNAYYEGLTSSFFRRDLERKWGSQLFQSAELTLKTFSPGVTADLQQENKLASEYVRLIASAKILFAGEERNLPQMGPFLQSTDREMRRRAYEARYGFFEDHEAKFDDIYDNLVKIRTRIARKLGFPNFVGLGYARMTRTDYNAEMVADFRDQVRDYIVPVATKLKRRQERRIGVDRLKYYDEGFQYPSGNPTPKGPPEWIVENGYRMYAELSPETKEFFIYMTENGLMDLVSRKGKAGGGYCTYIGKYRSPFIFSNFNGTSGDINVLTHEAGHAFQVYSSRDYNLPEYHFPTSEAAEIHSMSMEFFTWPWMNLFFEGDTEKYKFGHLSEALLFIPYGVAVDEFQHYVYENPGVTPVERKHAWRNIEKKYLPYRNYDENPYLDRGGYWHQQGHIFQTPFYYIDYTLAQICALQFWKRMNENRGPAWSDYLALCKQGGSKSFLKLVQSANLTSPFAPGCVQSVVGAADGWLDKVDDRKL
jgi:M3 family oligoendopeptidase